MKPSDLSRAVLLSALFAMAACGDDNGEGEGNGSPAGGHTGTIRVIPQGGQESLFYFDYEIVDGCIHANSDPMCDGGPRFDIRAIGFDEADTFDIGVDLRYCGPGTPGGAFGTLDVDIPLGSGSEGLLAVFLDGSVNVQVNGSRIGFTAPYHDYSSLDYDGVNPAGTLHFEADCSRGGIPSW